MWGMQVVAHGIVLAGSQLLLDIIVKAVAGFRLHQAGEGRIDQRAEVAGGYAELALAGWVQVEHGPAGLVQTLEAQHAQARWHWQLRHNLGRRTASGIGMAFHQAVGFQYAAGVQAKSLCH